MWVAARLLGSPGLEVVAIGIAALPLLAAFAAKRGARRILGSPAPVRRPRHARVTRDGDARRREPIPDRDVVPPAGGSAPHAARAGARLVIGGIRPGATSRRRYTLVPQSRGRYVLGPLVVDVSDPFALTRLRLEFDDRDELLVTPEIEDLGAAPDPVSGAVLRRLAGSAAVPDGSGVLHDARLPGGRRPPPDPLALRRADRRADDPPGRIDPACERARVPRHAGGGLGRTHTPAFERGVSVGRFGRRAARAPTGSCSDWERRSSRRRPCRKIDSSTRSPGSRTPRSVRSGRRSRTCAPGPRPTPRSCSCRRRRSPPSSEP